MVTKQPRVRIARKLCFNSRCLIHKLVSTVQEFLLSPEVWMAFGTLTALEIVLGIDNIIFISIVTGRLPPEQQARGRYLGLALAMIMRIGLLLSLSWIMSLTSEVFSVLGRGFSGRDLILLFGGAFLMAKATREVHNALEGESHAGQGGRQLSFIGVIC